jgi:hypothetical protein
LPLAALSGQSPDFFLHQQIHQLQTGLTDQLTHACPQPAHHLGHGQDHLHRRISIRGHCLELLALTPVDFACPQMTHQKRNPERNVEINVEVGL